ncbi:MAG: Crp/Fnr family transcriptional regulator [Novosphingobium sp.]
MQRTYQLSEIVPTRAEGELAALLAREGRRHRFAAGAIIQQQGDEGRGFWLVETGTVSICRFGPDGTVTIYAILGPGDLFGELAHFAGLTRQVDATAETDAAVVRIDARLIDRLLAEEPDFVRWLLKSLSTQLSAALDRIDRDRNLPALARIARLLSDMALRDGLDLAVTQQSLADVVGVSRITAGKVLGELAQSGLVRLGYRRVTVTDLAALTALDRQSPSHR